MSRGVSDSSRGWMALAASVLLASQIGEVAAQRVSRTGQPEPARRGEEPNLDVPDITSPDNDMARGVVQGPAQELKPRFQPGCTYRFVNELEVKLQFPVRGPREAKIEQQSRFDAGIRRDGKPGMSLKGRTERLKVEMKAMGESVSYDSLDAVDRQTPLGQHLNQSLTQWVELKLNEEDRIVSEEVGGRQATASPLEGFPQFGTSDLGQTVAVVLQGMPDTAVRPGESWVVKGVKSLTETGEVTLDILCRCRGEVTHEHNRFMQRDLTGEASGDVALPTQEPEGGEPVLMAFQVPTLIGKILYDPLEQMVRLSEQTVNMTVEIPGGPGVAPLVVPIQQKSTIQLLHVVPTP